MCAHVLCFMTTKPKGPKISALFLKRLSPVRSALPVQENQPFAKISQIGSEYRRYLVPFLFHCQEIFKKNKKKKDSHTLVLYVLFCNFCTI